MLYFSKAGCNHQRNHIINFPPSIIKDGTKEATPAPSRRYFADQPEAGCFEEIVGGDFCWVPDFLFHDRDLCWGVPHCDCHRKNHPWVYFPVCLVAFAYRGRAFYAHFFQGYAN